MKTTRMTAPEIRSLIDRVRKQHDLRGVEVALSQTDAGTRLAREALRAALVLREEVASRPTYSVLAEVSRRKRMGLLVTTSKRRAYVLHEARKAADEIEGFKINARVKFQARRIEAVRAYVLPAYKRCGYRCSKSTWAGGEHEVVLAIGEPGAEGWNERAWSDNRKWSGNNSTHRLTARRDYGSRVPSSLRVVGGLLTLDLDDEIEPGIRPAVWVEQGRGVSLNTVRGYLVLQASGGAVHAGTIAGARKARAATIRPRVDLGGLDVAGLLQRARLTGAERVTMDLAYDNGNGVCFAGMRDWLTKRGVDWTARDSLSTKEIAEMALTSKDRVEEVYRVLLIVARVHRQSARDMVHLAA